MTIPIDILAPSSLERQTERHQTLQQAAASPLSPESSVSALPPLRTSVLTAVGGRGCFSAVSKNIAKIKENSTGMKRPPSC